MEITKEFRQTSPADRTTPEISQHRSVLGTKGVTAQTPSGFHLAGVWFCQIREVFTFAAPCSSWLLGAGGAWECSQVNGSGEFIAMGMLNVGTRAKMSRKTGQKTSIPGKQPWQGFAWGYIHPWNRFARGYIHPRV